MQSQPSWGQYEERFIRVLSYIHTHLDDDLDMAAIAEIACLSPYHWHRIYAALMGETIAATVKRLRLHRAAGELVNSAAPVAAIAARAGYPNIQSFTRTFAESYGLPPARYRKRGAHGALASPHQLKGQTMPQIDIRETDTLFLAGIAHRGSYMTIGSAFERLTGLAGSRGLFRPKTKMLAIYDDDPNLVKEANLRSFAAVTIAAGEAVAPPLEKREISAGRYAVYQHKGPYAELHKAYERLYGEVLPQSKLTLRDAPCFEIYVNDPRMVAPADLVTEIWSPVE